MGGTHGLESLGHDLRPVVDGEHDVSDTSISQCLDLMLNHGLVRKLNERLGVGEGLQLLGSLSIMGDQRGRACAYKRPQTGSKPSDENDGCIPVSDGPWRVN